MKNPQFGTNTFCKEKGEEREQKSRRTDMREMKKSQKKKKKNTVCVFNKRQKDSFDIFK